MVDRMRAMRRRVLQRSHLAARHKLTGAYFGAAGNELGMKVTVEVTQPKQVEPVDLAGVSSQKPAKPSRRQALARRSGYRRVPMKKTVRFKHGWRTPSEPTHH